MSNDAKKMLGYLGMPVIEAPCEAESQCAHLVKHNLAYATLSEDMDSLTFGSSKLLRGLSSKNDGMTQIELKQVLKDL